MSFRYDCGYDSDSDSENEEGFNFVQESFKKDNDEMDEQFRLEISEYNRLRREWLKENGSLEGFEESLNPQDDSDDEPPNEPDDDEPPMNCPQPIEYVGPDGGVSWRQQEPHWTPVRFNSKTREYVPVDDDEKPSWINAKNKLGLSLRIPTIW